MYSAGVHMSKTVHYGFKEFIAIESLRIHICTQGANINLKHQDQLPHSATFSGLGYVVL